MQKDDNACTPSTKINEKDDLTNPVSLNCGHP